MNMGSKQITLSLTSTTKGYLYIYKGNEELAYCHQVVPENDPNVKLTK